MIVVEGMEGTGKTTLARTIAKGFGLKYEGPMGPGTPETQRSHVYEALEHAVGGNVPVRVYDRLFFSELVYGSVLRDGPVFSDEEISFVQRILVAAQIPVFVCQTDKEAAVENHLKDEDSDHNSDVTEHFDELWEAYQYPMVSSFVTSYYDYANPDMDFISGHVREYLEKRKLRSW